jgi:cyclin-dependent kinase regulatory subunit CKS1
MAGYDEETDFRYSNHYSDTEFEYRHVILPPAYSQYIPTNRLMTEEEWRALGVRQSKGWVHYAKHNPEPHILLFRRQN